MLAPFMVILVYAFAAVSEVQSQCIHGCPSNRCSQHSDSGYCQKPTTTYEQVSTITSQYMMQVVYHMEPHSTTCWGFLGFPGSCLKYRTGSSYKQIAQYKAVYKQQTTLKGACQPYCCDGYTGSGSSCTPICVPECRDGGTCIRPNVCAYPSTYGCQP